MVPFHGAVYLSGTLLPGSVSSMHRTFPLHRSLFALPPVRPKPNPTVTSKLTHPLTLPWPHLASSSHPATCRAEDAARQRAEVWRPGVDGMEEDEELEYDPTAYDCLHAWSLEWPCLSFDIIRDELGDDRTHFPHTLFAIAGTQAEKASQNSLTLMRVTRLKRTRRREKSAGANGGDDSEESDSVGSIPHRPITFKGEPIPHCPAQSNSRSRPLRPIRSKAQPLLFSQILGPAPCVWSDMTSSPLRSLRYNYKTSCHFDPDPTLSPAWKSERAHYNHRTSKHATHFPMSNH